MKRDDFEFFVFLGVIVVIFTAIGYVGTQNNNLKKINATLIQRAQRDSAEAAHYRKIIDNQLIIYQNDTCR